ncbi:hypothetical protein AK830_g9787 [Neonectria ditissima]|uniref:Xylanolytic transcriptional activator regulatory domain-containing protein n=1 Tax=Neonectria ditissima TaxID=78410 RepID=A0A0P7B533_9HYPO|nr:hypothetical protein AK830_g9787 [Neonectria ditissima]
METATTGPADGRPGRTPTSLPTAAASVESTGLQSSQLDISLSDPQPQGHSTEEVRSEVTSTETLQEDQYGYVHGGASEFAYLQYAKQKLASLPSVSIHFYDSPLERCNDFASILPPKPVSDELMRSFFDFGLTTSRFVHEPSLRKAYESLYENGNANDELGWDTLALIYMVLALGSHYSKLTNMFCGYTASVRFYDMALKQPQQETGRITLASLQTRLLTIHYLIHHSRLHEAWSSFGILVRQAQALGLHRKSLGPSTNFITYEYRKRLFWTIYTNDRVLSSVFGRPCAIHDDDIGQDECALANDEDICISACLVTKSGGFCSGAALVHYARLAQILGRILRELYSPATRLRSITRLHESAMGFEKDLTSWQDNLPPYLNYVILPQSASSVVTQRQMCTLKLMFAHTSLLLYRPFILYSIERGPGQQTSLEQWVKRCHDKAIEVAIMVVSECRYLLQQGLFSRVFWMVNYVQFAFIGTLFMYSHIWPEAAHVRDVAQGALDEFSIGVEGDSLGQRYVEVLTELRDITGAARTSNSITPARPWQDGEASASEVSWADMSGPWSNLFFDTTILSNYMDGEGSYEMNM